MTNVLEGIESNPRPLDAANWWKRQPPSSVADALDDEEQGYLEVFTSSAVSTELQIGRGIADPSALTVEEQQKAAKLFGADPAAKQQFANYENRRRIIAHYTLTHPATIAYEMGLYRLSRDLNPVTFVMERVYQVITGKEAFTDADISRLRASVELLLPVAIGRLFNLVRVVPLVPERTTSLTDPIWDLPPQGGGMRINGRWYTEHALERMAPDTLQVNAELEARLISRLRKAGLNPGSPAWKVCLDKGFKKVVDPRGIPPSVVEAEIQNPGSTNVKVITAKRQQVVVTVMPRKEN
jgi:hypothetical protein